MGDEAGAYAEVGGFGRAFVGFGEGEVHVFLVGEVLVITGRWVWVWEGHWGGVFGLEGKVYE